MKRNKMKRLIAALLSAVMVCGTVLPSFAKATTETTPSVVMEDLAPFTTTEDLIEQVKQRLYNEGKLILPEAEDQNLVKAVESRSDYTYEQAKNLLSHSFFTQREGAEGEINTERLNLTKQQMKSLVEAALQSSYLTDTVDVDYKVQGGIVTGIEFVMRDSFAAGLDGIQANGNAAAAQLAAEEPVEEYSWDNWTAPRGGACEHTNVAYRAVWTQEESAISGSYKCSCTVYTYCEDCGLMTASQKADVEPASAGVDSTCNAKVDDKVVSYYTVQNDTHEHTYEAKLDLWSVDSEAVTAQIYSGCECGAGKVENAVVSYSDDTATCTTAGEITYKAALEEGGATVGTYTVTTPAKGHNTTYVEATNEYQAHYKCDNCDKLFKDKDATQSTTLEELKVVNTCTHGSYKRVERVEPTCTEPGSEAYCICKGCSAYLEAKTGSDGSIYAGAELTQAQIDALVIPATGHSHELLDAVWAPAYVYYTDDGTITGNILNQNPDPYGAPYIVVKVDGVETQISTMALVYNPATKEIGYAPAVMQYNWTCTEFTVGCAECEQSESITDNITITSVTYDDAYFAAHPEDQANLLNYGSTVFTATYTGSEGTFTAELNGTQRQMMEDWAVMCKFNADHAEYFGAPAPYWTAKNGEESPVDAIIWLCNMQEEDFIPDSTLQYMISMLTQAFMSYVLQYGDMLTAMKEDALSAVSIGMTDIQIYLMIHEWVAKYATFDMQNMVDQMSGSSAGSDPISMTPFGTLLADQLNLNGVGDNGGICLGYAATYVWLVQSAFKEMGKLGHNISYDYFRENPIVDFVQIKYLTNVEDASVADGDSGFGEGDAMFNAPHYFNAVKAHNTGDDKDYWYYVDAAYDDINVETISQYRVETDGNISHSQFMLSPVTMEEQYEDKFQYLDSLYDGVKWERVPCVDDDGTYLGWYKMTGDGKKLTPEEAEFYEKYEGGQTFYYYERVDAPEETAYDDDTYEQTWFSNVISEITYDKKSGAFYYVEGTMNSYSAMKDLMGDDDSIMDSMSPSEMEEYRNDPAYADEMRARPIGASDLPSNYGQNNNNSMMGGMNMYEDEESIVIFHYGFGTYGKAAQASHDEHSGNNNFMGGSNDYTEEDYGPFYEELQEDEMYRDLYPELTHSVIVHNGTLYFNLGTKIFTYDLSKYTSGTYTILNSDGEVQFPRGEIYQLKEYIDVTFGSDGRRFAGMSFYTDSSVWADTMVDGSPLTIDGPQTIYYHPIAALCLKNQIEWTNEVDPETGIVIARYRSLVPTLYVSIGTNYSNSYKGTADVAYSEEAVNYNSSYYRYMDDNKDDNENTNTEFMWCANVVDKMVMETLLNDTETKTVTYGAYCEKAGFTETRSAIYGLSDGSTKTEVAGDPAHYHNYELHPIDKTLVCTVCLKPHDATIEQPTVTDEDGNEVVEDYIDTHKHTEITEEDVTFEWYTKEDGTQGCRALLYCEEEYCNRNSDWIEAEVTGEEGNMTATVTVVVEDVDYRGNVVTSTVTYTAHKANLGDVNEDGEVDIFDVAMLRLAVENLTIDELSLSTADVNRDGEIDIFDVALLRLHVETLGEIALG